MSQPNLVLLEFAALSLPRHESYSPFCMKVSRALRYAGLSYERREAGPPDHVVAMNPKGQLPILLVDDEVVYDSTPILRRIERLSPLAALSSPEARLWEEMADGALYGYLVASRWADDENWERTREAYFQGIPEPVRRDVTKPIRERVIGSLVGRDVWRGGPAECWSRLEALLDDLEARAPSQGFWLGDELSCADLSLFPQLHGYRTELTPRQHASVERRARLVAYLDRVHEATWTPRAARKDAA
ncbi:MAG: glutathione S-transferase family protein [Polyangiales bacterium]